MYKINPIDCNILEIIQHDAALSIAEIADRIGLSHNACWRRLKLLESSGIIEKRVAILNPDKIGGRQDVFVTLKTNQHTQDWLTIFSAGVKNIPEVLGFYRMTGDIDYMLKLSVKNMTDYDRVYKKIIAIAPLHDVSASFAMERIKNTTAIPIT